MKIFNVSISALAILASQPALSCGTKPISESSRLSVASGEVTDAASYKIFASQSQLDASPVWKPGGGEMPMSTADAYKIVNDWAKSDTTVQTKPAEAWSVQIKGCPKETVFRYFLFDLKGGPKVAVLFDGTVLTEVRKGTYNKTTRLRERH
ncbi:MAG: hypothetical protein AAF385_06295 [Pseudomonadota bacterium]